MKYLLFLFSPLLISCSNDVRFIENYITGNWAIDYAEYSDSIKHTPFSNIISFNEDHTGASYIFDPREFKWNINKNENEEYFLGVETTNLKVDFQIAFDRNAQKRLFVMCLFSDYAYLESTKMFNSYEMNAHKLERAMRLTKKK
jgi:hypothetical protein